MANKSKLESTSPFLLANEVFPDRIVIFPLPYRERVIFPSMMFPIQSSVFSKNISLEELNDKYNNTVGIVSETTEDTSVPIEKRLYHVGCVAKIARREGVGEGDFLLVNVIKRFIIKEIISTEPVIVAEVQYVQEVIDRDDQELKAYSTALITKIKDLIKLNPIFKEEMKFFVSQYGMQDPGAITDLVSTMLSGTANEELLEVLATFDLKKRIPLVLGLIQKEIEISNVKEQINRKIEEKVSKQQREFFLNEQLKQIKKELGMEKDEKSEEIERFKAKIDSLKLTEEAKKVAQEELEKMNFLDPRNSEYAVSRNYLQWICDLPWEIYTKDVLDINKIKKQLNNEHYGMEDVKKRILQFVAVQKLKNTMLGTVLLLVGPPGVGKTSLAKSIAKALGRKSYSFSLGAMRDEAELKGHRRTYIGAMPGKMIQSLKVTHSSNPVIILDEVDKMGSGLRGDPSSTLLEILDREQNYMFLDHFMDIRVDLSHVFFIATANQLDTIPAPVLDRTEVIELSGYLTTEKLVIANSYVIPKMLDETGLKKEDISFTEEGIKKIISGYARESGVRSLQQHIRNICMQVALEKVQKKEDEAGVVIDEKKVLKYLGQERFRVDRVYKDVVPGIVSGLAWTSVGGSTLYIESKVYQEKTTGDIKFTGKLGDVMKESVLIAYSYVQAIVDDYEVEKDFFTTRRIHLHVPEGATPKDGPSAGITMATSLFSLALNKKVPEDFAMTGELTISGKVLPIGGVKEKVMAARRSGKKKLIFPMENKPDFDELAPWVQKDIKIYFVEEFPDVIDIVFGKSLRKKEKKRG